MTTIDPNPKLHAPGSPFFTAADLLEVLLPVPAFKVGSYSLDCRVSRVPFQQYRSKQELQPLGTAVPVLVKLRLSAAHAIQAGHSESKLPSPWLAA